MTAISLLQIKISINLKIAIMKNLFKFSLMLGVALVTMNVHASDVDFSLGVKKEQGRVISFVINETNKLDLSIYDSEGKIIYTENLDSQTVIDRSYDLKSLPDGVYFLVAESELKLAKYKISIVGKTAELSETPILEEFKPLFMKKDGLVKVNFLNLNESAIVIKIYDRDDNVVYDSGVIKEQNITKIFDVFNIENEVYTISLTDNNKTYSKTF
jgi:hypothetical protein